MDSTTSILSARKYISSLQVTETGSSKSTHCCALIARVTTGPDELADEMMFTTVINTQFQQVEDHDTFYGTWYFTESNRIVEAAFHTALVENTMPLSVCVDLGAPRSVLGLLMLKCILSKTKQRDMPMRKSNNIFVFGGQRAHSLGTADLFLKTPVNVLYVPVIADVVKLDVPALLRHDILGAYQLNADTIANTLIHKKIFTNKHGNTSHEELWYMLMA